MKRIRVLVQAGLVCLGILDLSLVAHAADVKGKAPAAGVVDSNVWDWRGPYVGAHIGAVAAPTSWQSVSTGNATFQEGSTLGGAFAGGQLGYNWQRGTGVLGLELGGSATDASGFAKCQTGTYVCNTEMNWLATVAARLGIAEGRVLYYGKAGLVVAHDTHRLTSSLFNNIYEGVKTRAGWTAGAGIEYALLPRLSAFAEYDWVGFGTALVPVSDQSGTTANVDVDQSVQLLKFGLNVQLGARGGANAGAAESRGVAAPLLSDWSVTAGTRYWYSSGRMAKDLYDPAVNTQMNSRLTYGDETGHSLEGFLRFDHDSGLFIKGFLGVGVLSDGSDLLDEDFPPEVAPYSATDSVLKGDRLRYGGIDVGHTVWSGRAGKVGPFVGYRFMYQQANGYGCVQAATSSICSPPFPESQLGLSETMAWRGLAVGLNGQAHLTDRLTLSADLAYLPYVDLSAFDNHWARNTINPQVETGDGWGTQLQALISYAVTPRWSIGIGARYWYFKTRSAGTRFPMVATTSPEEMTAIRYGGFVQSAYKFDASDIGHAPATDALIAGADRTVANWRGFYVGIHAGGGWGTEDWNAANSNILTLSGDKFPGSGTMSGLLAGGQIGFNLQRGAWVFGPELRASWSNLEGNAICSSMPGARTSTVCNAKTRAIGSITGRLGRAAGRFLLYGKGGVAWAQNDYSLRLAGNRPFAFSGSAVRWGWTAGAGLDVALSRHWSLEAEYNYASFGDGDVSVTDSDYGASSIDVDQEVHLFTVGANYRWNAGRAFSP